MCPQAVLQPTLLRQTILAEVQWRVPVAMQTQIPHWPLILKSCADRLQAIIASRLWKLFWEDTCHPQLPPFAFIKPLRRWPMIDKLPLTTGKDNGILGILAGRRHMASKM